MISELDETIRQVLIKEGGFEPAEVDISFEIPNSEWSARVSKPTINCYLFDIRENQQLKEQGWQMEKPAPDRMQRRKPMLYFDLTYLLTAWTREVEDEHRLLWHALQTLVRFPVLPEQHYQGGMRESISGIITTIAKPGGVLQSTGEFWTALGNQIKPSLNYVTTLPMDRDAVPAGPPVFGTSIKVAPPGGTATEELHGFAGVIRDERGEGVAGAIVELEGTAVRAVADTKGRFRLRAVAPGRYVLVARAPGFTQRREIDIPVPASPAAG